MCPLPLVDEGDLTLVVRYTPDAGESMSEAIVNAFLAAGLDVFDRPTHLVDWVDADAFETLDWSDDDTHYFATNIWDHRVVMASEEVRIYTPPGET